MNMPPRLMLVGLGDLGFRVLGQLLRRPYPIEVAIGGRSTTQLQRLVRLQQFTALQYERWINVDVLHMDINDPGAMAETIAQWRPDVIFNGMSLQSWRVITQLPPPIFAELDTAQFGPWLPMHATPMLALMEALKQSGLKDVTTINSAFPDATNPLLATAELAPTCGIGNVANIIPALRCSAAKLLKAKDPLETHVLFYAQHFLSHGIPRSGTADGAPFHLQVVHRREDVTQALDPADLFHEVSTTFKRQGGVQGQELTAASAITLLDALLNDGRHIVHVPGPAGLPGGWAAHASASGVIPLIPDGCTLKSLIAINEEGQTRDGIERIDADGTVWFTEKNMAVMKRLLGWDVRKLHRNEMAAAASELGQCYAAFATNHETSR